jgi:YspA, cpYpsA-related SLOG family
MKIVVCGGRTYGNRERVFAVLDGIHAETPVTVLMHGNARGADNLADDWAAGKCETKTFHPLWEVHGKSAGPKRNQEMVDERPDLVVAFPGSRGTADMVRRAKAAGIPVRIIDG